MKRILVMKIEVINFRVVNVVAMNVLLAALLIAGVPPRVWAASRVFTNQHGTIDISDSGIASKGSVLVAFGEIVATKGHPLGTVSFTVGPLLDGSLDAGGHFSSFGSSFVIAGNGRQGVPKGPIFVGAYVGKVRWRLVSQEGQKLVFRLSGHIRGTLYTGVTVEFLAKQTIVTSKDQLSEGIAHIRIGQVISSI